MDQAYVIHHYAYRESSLLLKLWTIQLGYVTAIARGAKERKQYKHLLRPFGLMAVELTGKGDILTLKTIEPVGESIALVGKALYAGLYLNELLLRLLPSKEPLPTLFFDYQQALLGLANQQPPEPILRKFEWQLLATLGYEPTLSVDMEHLPIEPDHHYHVLPGQLPQKMSSPQQQSNVYLGAQLLAIEQQNWQDPDVLKAAKRFMRHWLEHYLDHRPLKSKSLYQSS